MTYFETTTRIIKIVPTVNLKKIKIIFLGGFMRKKGFIKKVVPINIYQNKSFGVHLSKIQWVVCTLHLNKVCKIGNWKKF